MKYILSIDQGTTSSRAILFDAAGCPVDCAQQEFPQHFPSPGLVEHDPEDIWESVRQTVATVLSRHPEAGIAGIGITNQRETTVVWDAFTGRAVYNAIVWQDRRTAPFCATLAPYEEMIRSRTGLIPDAYFSATKIRWILENVPGAADAARQGRLRFGTVDSFLVWRLTGGRVHATDVTNASRTMLFDINNLCWDADLLELFGVPATMMPRVLGCSEVYGRTGCGMDGCGKDEAGADGCGTNGCGSGRPSYSMEGIPEGIPIAGIAGDQQAALFGQMCLEKGSVKNTYGTGCFLLMNCGDKPVTSSNRLLSTVAWKIGNRVDYALEGSVFVAGSAVQWLRDGLGLIQRSCDVEALAESVPDSGGVYFVPALTGLGAPYWNAEARGMICGLTRGTTAGHIARATLEGIAFETMDVMDAMRRDAGIDVTSLKVDGGASRNGLLMQFQADLLGVEVVRPRCVETTARGAAFLAGLAVGFWPSLEALSTLWEAEKVFKPERNADEMTTAIEGWHRAVGRC